MGSECNTDLREGYNYHPIRCLQTFPLTNQLSAERISLPHSCNISSLQERLCNNNSTCNIDGLWLNTERVLLHTHTHTANTHLLRDFVSCAICRTDAGACQAISCLRWFSLSPLRREQLGPSGFARQQENVWTRASKMFTLGSHVCADVGLCAHVRGGVRCEAASHFSCGYHVTRERKRKRALPKNAKPWHPPPLSLT